MSCKASKSEGLSYKTAGVDIDAGNELVRRIQKMNPNIGGFSGMVPFGSQTPLMQTPELSSDIQYSIICSNSIMYLPCMRNQ